MLFTKIKPILEDLNAEFEYQNTIENPIVSVCIITYNHEKFIAKCLDSILAQNLNRPFEIIIGDDASTDNTQQIIKDYKEKYPRIIKCFLRKENLSQKSKEFTQAKLNFLHTLYNCKGKYIVNIEGDDYLCYDNKFQKQVDFLEGNVKYSACFHNAIMKFEDGSGQQDYPINPENQKSEIVAEDLLGEREAWFMATASVMFKSSILEQLPVWFAKSKSGDIPLYILLCQMGPIWYMSDIMSVYRRHVGGMSFTDNRQHDSFVSNRIFMYKNLNRETNFKYKKLINPILAEFYEFKAESDKYSNSTFYRTLFILKAISYRSINLEQLKLKLPKMLSPFLLQKRNNLLHKLKLRE